MGKQEQKSFKKFLNVEKLQTLRVYDTIDQEIYEDLDRYMNLKKMGEESRHRVQKIVRQELSCDDGITDRKVWQEQMPSILIESTDLNESGIWYNVLPAAEAKEKFELITDLKNLSEDERNQHPKDYRALIGLLDRKNIMNMPVYEISKLNPREHERVAAYMHTKNMTKPAKTRLMDVVRRNIREIICFGETRREELKNDKPALMIKYNFTPDVGIVPEYTVEPKMQAAMAFARVSRKL